MIQTEDLAIGEKTLSSSQQETRNRILDAAEGLFAESGFSAVSLRQITSEAGVNVAAVNYHFGNRESLISEVIGRVLDPINRDRLRLLDGFEKEYGSKPVPVARIVEAAFRPVVMDLPQEGDGAHRFLRLAGQCFNERDAQFPEAIQRVFREVADRFVAAFQRALPHLSEADIYWRLHFTAGALLYTLTQDDRLAAISEGQVTVGEPEETMAQLMAFMVAGMEAPRRVKSAPNETRSKTGVAGMVMAVALGISGASCTATAPPNSAEQAKIGEVPEDWKAGSTSASSPEAKNPRGFADRDWVGSFGDDRLEKLVSEALENNKDLAAAAARIEIAHANVAVIGADLSPQVSGIFRGSRQKRNFIGFPFGGDAGGEGGGAPVAGGGGQTVASNLNNEFGLSLDLSWEIDLWGRIRAGQSGAISDAQAITADRAGAELSIAGQVAKSWFALQEAKAQVVLAESAVEVFQDTEKAIRDRFEAGINDGGQNLASQLRLAMVDVETARDTLIQRQEQVEQAARQIEILMGRYPAGALKGNGRLVGVPKAPPAGMPADLLDRRPDLHAAERRMAATDRRLVEAKRTALPAISLTGSPGRSSEQIEDLLDRNFSIWSLAGSAVQPIFYGGVIKQGIRMRKAEVKESAAQFEKTVLTAFGEVENALAAEHYLADRESALKRAADLASEAKESASEEFVDGTGDILTMLTAQQRLFQQRSQLISIKRLRLINRIDLHLALGGGFESPVPRNESSGTDES